MRVPAMEEIYVWNAPRQTKPMTTVNVPQHKGIKGKQTQRVVIVHHCEWVDGKP